MIINLIKSDRMFSLTLPSKVKGRYWLTDRNQNGDPRELISIEAIDGQWVAKSNATAQICDFYKDEELRSAVMEPDSLFKLRISGSPDRVILFAENVDNTRQKFRKLVARGPGSFTIGREDDNQLRYGNLYVSQPHATLTFDGSAWTLTDTGRDGSGSTNGTYVNGCRVRSATLAPGDLIYIMGLRIVIGKSFIAMNNPDGIVKVRSDQLSEFRAQTVQKRTEDPELPEKDFFYRSPRFHREIKRAELHIDPPPPEQKIDSVPLALMLGPSLTMGMTSVSTGIFTLNNVLANGGQISQAMPTLVASVSMLLGTVLWPILTKRYETHQGIKNEKERHEKYLRYLDDVRDHIRRLSQEQSDILNENLVPPDECGERIRARDPKLWERMLGQSADYLRLRIGVGETPLAAEIKYPEKKFTVEDDALQNALLSLGSEPKKLRGVPLSISLVDNIAVGICGPAEQRANLLRALILQMIALHSYDELKIMLITDGKEAKNWNFARALPHFWDNEREIRFFAENAGDAKELSAYLEKNLLSRSDAANKPYSEYAPYYVIVSTSAAAAKGCDALRQLLRYRHNSGFSVILSAAELRELPKESRLVVSLDGAESRIFDRGDTTGKDSPFVPDEVGAEKMDGFSRSAANIELDLGGRGFSLPSQLTFLELFNVSKIEHLNSLTRWKENNPTKTLETPVGVDAYGEKFYLDLHETYHGPHGLVAGMTGSGKSQFIITYILSMAVNYHPDEVAFILIDYKGGDLAGAFEDAERGIKLPHLAGTITNLDGSAIKRSLASIQSELSRREAIFNEARKLSNEGTMDIYKYQQLYRDKVVDKPLPHLFIISDEFAELKMKQREFVDQLISTARIGRSLGVHLILATQKPENIVDDEIWSNSRFHACFKVQEKSDSQSVIKCPDAAELKQTGRFYLQVGYNELFALGQSAWCGADYVPKETVEKTADPSIRIVDNLGRAMISVRPPEPENDGDRQTQLVAVVKYLSDLVADETIGARPLWCDPIPDVIYIDALEEKYGCHSAGMALEPLVGEYDDPFNQEQYALYIPISREGNCLVFGSNGNGKTTFLTAVCYSLIKHHSADEVNLYIMDFGSETLRAFERAPQVGDVMLASDEEKIVNLIKMLKREVKSRRGLFSEFGGSHAGYCRGSGKTVPNIVVILNNYSGFAEQFEDLQEELTLLTRDGAKYGVYFVVSAVAANAVRYKMQQNFRMTLTMQLNDATDYPVVVGKTDGLVPAKCKGRGLVPLDKVYEFQTAYVREEDKQQAFLRRFCQTLTASAKAFARPVPVLPKTVDREFVRAAIGTLQSVPVGVSKRSMGIARVDVEGRVVLPVVAQELGEAVPFLEELRRVLSASARTVVVDSERLLREDSGIETVSSGFEPFVAELYNEMLGRNNAYKDANRDVTVLDGREEIVYLIVGMKRLCERLSADGQDKLKVLIEKAEPFYKLHFVIADALSWFVSFPYDAWYTRQVTGADGIWVGDGFADQYVLKPDKLASELYEEIGPEYGYVLTRNRPTLVKLLSSTREE